MISIKDIEEVSSKDPQMCDCCSSDCDVVLTTGNGLNPVKIKNNNLCYECAIKTTQEIFFHLTGEDLDFDFDEDDVLEECEDFEDCEGCEGCEECTCEQDGSDDSVKLEQGHIAVPCDYEQDDIEC